MKDERVDRNWQWKKTKDGAYLTCGLLADWQHGFFSQDFYPQTPEELTSILQPDTKAYRVKQVHGDRILNTQEIDRAIAKENLSSGFPDADGVISNDLNRSVWVASADCTPILVGDCLTGGVCAIHAGWRGTSQNIVSKAISRFLEFGSQLDNLRIAIGPAIAGEVYQVDEEVAIKVGKTVIGDAEVKTNPEILSELQQLPNSPIFADELLGKVRLSVSRVNQLQLKQLKIDPAQIAIARDFCTYQQSEHFFSYRRTGEKKVQWSGIVSMDNGQ